ncbi:hypothetical protein PLICRDRAFT_120490, partial [Plicaturopsis crispa FD-325 SS-3]
MPTINTHSDSTGNAAGESIPTSHSSSLSVLTMPLPGTRNAPRKFKGKSSETEEFLDIYDRLLRQNNITSNEDKCKSITQYCSSKVKSFVKALTSYQENRWDTLRQNLLDLYDADLATTKYRQKDLLKFVKESRAKPMKNLTQWKRYCRRFIPIAGYLRTKKKINEDEYATYFWAGIPKSFRAILEARLLAKDPSRDMSTPFKYEEVEKVATAYLQRDKFPSMLIDSDSEDEDGTLSDLSDESSDSDSSDSDSDDERERRKKKKKEKLKSALKKSQKKKRTAKDDGDEEDEKPAKRRPSAHSEQKKHDKVEGLIKQLNRMNLDDADYGATYYKALKIDNDIQKVVRPP